MQQASGAARPSAPPVLVRHRTSARWPQCTAGPVRTASLWGPAGCASRCCRDPHRKVQARAPRPRVPALRCPARGSKSRAATTGCAWQPCASWLSPRWSLALDPSKC